MRPKCNRTFCAIPRQRLRLLVSGMDRDLTLETSPCHRTLTASGCLIEVVRLDGRCEGLTDEDLEKFVKSFPMQMI